MDSGDGDKEWKWLDSTDSWTANQSIEVAGSSLKYRIDGVDVLTKTGLGSTVVGSSLTSVGTIGTGVWAATDVAVAHGGTGASTAAGALTNFGLTATAAELNIMDGVTATATELNTCCDGGTSATSTTLATADRMVINDNGTMVQVALTDLVTFLENGSVSGFELDGGTF